VPAAPRVSVAVPSFPVSRLSGSIADHLRREIIRGNLKAGDALPPEGELIAQWGVSRSTLREAFRVLETESLITVHRGARGGARVTPPQPQVAARHVGQLLQHRGATMGDITRGVIVIQPRAVYLLTERQPREVLRALHDSLEHEAAFLGDPVAFSRSSLEFGRQLTDGCGDEMLRVFGEILYYLRSGAADYVMLAHFGGGRLQVEGRKAVQRVYRRQRRLMELIDAGEPSRAERHWRSFLEEQLSFMPEAADQLLYEAWPDHQPPMP
jgi:GntR family transcriptional regulator, transcriptional repressor for pyruvate dehydrogenase complex